jgi:Cu+-exporting ATPase
MHQVPKNVDPVCGMTVEPATAAGSHEHNGTIYYFCSTHCLEKFRRDPEVFLHSTVPSALVQPIEIQRARPETASHQPEDASQHPDTTYTCPMHPEIVRDAPGSCPICGMALEPRTITLDEPENPELRKCRDAFG